MVLPCAVQETRASADSVFTEELSEFIRCIYHQLLFKYGSAAPQSFVPAKYDQLEVRRCEDTVYAGYCEYNIHILTRTLRKCKISSVTFRFVDSTNFPMFEVEIKLLPPSYKNNLESSWANWGYRAYLKNCFSATASTICSINLPVNLVNKLHNSDQRLIITFVSSVGVDNPAIDVDRRLRFTEVSPFIRPTVVECGNSFEAHSSILNFSARFSNIY